LDPYTAPPFIYEKQLKKIPVKKVVK